MPLVSKEALLSWDLRRAHLSIPISRFSLHRLQRIERKKKTKFLYRIHIRLQMELRIDHYSASGVLRGPNRRFPGRIGTGSNLYYPFANDAFFLLHVSLTFP